MILPRISNGMLKRIARLHHRLTPPICSGHVCPRSDRFSPALHWLLLGITRGTKGKQQHQGHYDFLARHDGRLITIRIPNDAFPSEHRFEFETIKLHQESGFRKKNSSGPGRDAGAKPPPSTVHGTFFALPGTFSFSLFSSVPTSSKKTHRPSSTPSLKRPSDFFCPFSYHPVHRPSSTPSLQWTADRLRPRSYQLAQRPSFRPSL